MLTVVVLDVVRDVHISIGILQPHAAVAGAGVSISVAVLDSNVSFSQFGFTGASVCKTNTRCSEIVDGRS